MIPGHQVDAVLREIPGARRVLRTTVAGQACVTRVLLSSRVGIELGPLIEQAARHGRGSIAGVPEALLLTLEGYRVAARLPQPDPRWPQALAAGVTPEGFAFVTTRWIEGTPLSEAIPAEDRRDVALAVLGVLAELHARNVAYGDLKPENLVRGADGVVALIDLDTLREVAGATIPAITRDLTRTWAAPEQEHQQRTYLASDLWGWARLVEHLWPEGPPPEWRLALLACRSGDPLRRPRTDVLYAGLRGDGDPLVDWHGRPTPTPGSTETERVPETPRLPVTERVPESPTSGNTLRPRPVAKRRLGCVGWFGILAAIPIGLCGGGALWWDHQNAVEANRLAEEAMSALKAHKTRADLNDPSQRPALRALAEQAWDTRHTPRSGAVRALAIVWSQGWQDAGSVWDGEAFEEARTAIEAVDDSHQPEALLAFGTLYAASCRLDGQDATSSVHCARALDALAEFDRRVPTDAEHDWLRVEAAWTEVLVRAERASKGLAAHLPDARDDLVAAAKRCDATEPLLPFAPVNGPELVQDCLRIAGIGADVDGYFRWAGRIVDPDARDGSLQRTTIWRIYAGAGDGCDIVTVDKRRGEWVVKGPWWCRAMGDTARHCYASSEEAKTKGMLEEPDRPWSALETHLAPGDGDWQCLR